VRVGQSVNLTLDAFKDKSFAGTVNAISPKVETDTRNVMVEARVPNPDRVLTPGMFVNVSVDVGTQRKYLTLPQTSVVYNPYGETVYVVTTKAEFDKQQAAAAVENSSGAASSPPKPAANKGPRTPPDTKVVQQQFVTSGPKRGDQVAILTGLNEGQEVVTSGQIKLKAGAPISIDNRVKPSNSPNPTPQEQ
jgi:membrane fusion protein (multidrug efflux system)